MKREPDLTKSTTAGTFFVAARQMLAFLLFEGFQSSPGMSLRPEAWVTTSLFDLSGRLLLRLVIRRSRGYDPLARNQHHTDLSRQ